MGQIPNLTHTHIFHPKLAEVSILGQIPNLTYKSYIPSKIGTREFWRKKVKVKVMGYSLVTG